MTLHLPTCHTLKEKRQIVKSITARVHNLFEVAIAEVAENDRWQIAKLGVSCVSNSAQHAAQMLERVLRFIEETRPDVVLADAETEVLRW